MPPATLAPALRALRERGFKPVSAKGATRAFDGSLKTRRGDVPIRFEISDWDLLTYPRITLRQRPSFLPDPLSHVDETGGLCYLRQGSIVLDRYEAGGAVLQCLDAAQKVLEDLATNPSRGDQDLQDEFLAYWQGAQEKPFRVVLGEIGAKAASAQFFVLDPPRLGIKVAMVATDSAECSGFAAAIGAPAPKTSSCKCWILRSAVYPVAPENGLPTTIKELFDYLNRWDRTLYNGVQRVLEYEKDYLLFPFVAFAIDTPAGWLGFCFDLAEPYRTGYSKKPRLYKQYLHRKGSGRGVTRLWITEVGSTFVHGRNLTHANLAGKKVVLLGCGAVGGYLAQALVRLGAGTGKRGKLRLIDAGWLGPENLGRHWLGMPGLFLPKGRAMAEELQRQFPHARLEWDEANAAAVAPILFEADLVIDATGDEPVNELVNEAYLRRTSLKAPVLYAWIKGNGECVQALFVDGSGGCYRCLRVPIDRGERFPVLKRTPVTRFVGCHSFTPYAVAAPMQAAALAAELLGDWLQGDPAPRFRTRTTSNADTRVVRDQDLAPMKNCPACTGR